MAEEQPKKLEREYVVPLRRHFLKVPRYRRAGKAARALKIFIAKHMKVPERDVEKVKLDIYLNNEIWAHGIRNPPSKIKVRAIKEGDIVKVELVELPAHIKFLKAKHERRHQVEEKKEEKVASGKTSEEVKEEKTEEQKKDESEKEKAGEAEKLKEAKKDKHVQKHTGKDKNVEIRRRSMDRH